ncbi:MAG: hypothetical protein JWM33_3845 [Caulobacteraceae bacterium]|nr:hypothetical protein [Caulobacteraceae bacterium]
MTPPDFKARKLRNWVIFTGLMIFVVVVFFVTIFRLGGHALDRPF